MTQHETLHADVAALVESVVLRLVRGDEPLLETGLVDSVLAVEIVMGVEMQFGVRIPPTEIAEHLASVDALCAFIAANR
ncbi:MULTISPECIES: acyl carrier protein [Paraburkholderia]|uniref:Acyl carrier protein n=1 Tax=Paraburkholderia madseniana TaxID=2599607 RepID=A0A6N6WAD2_9BURK|nr:MULTISPECIES: acyl carrier protein [Paraburkholderia]KAE8756838.1 acyl carrier protein [Paraburkholderia madseniana]MCX4151215.1 acyl carrier protein [Paraburkholderia madseniana]MCX4176413.1 acyl carrier protein [Paraburkholderia madseniana]MDN7154147.1 acyl carrier protein [Paraburkholderia sp. WS6]MDQ6413029.1 acyl carrier protein [Paraburkholderia madseniana]